MLSIARALEILEIVEELADKNELSESESDAVEIFARHVNLFAAASDLLASLERIANHEPRSDRRKTNMVDVSEVYDLMRIARTAIARAREER